MTMDTADLLLVYNSMLCQKGIYFCLVLWMCLKTSDHRDVDFSTGESVYYAVS